MGGKGIRRREKNYRAAHGGSTRLPPPPDPSSLDAVPCKLRELMSLTGAGKQSVDGVKSVRRNDGAGDIGKKLRLGDGVDSKTIGVKRERDDQNLIKQHAEHGESNVYEKKKKKRKRKSQEANDLRFETEEQTVAVGSKRKERKKQRLEAMKKKNKKGKQENLDFPGHEKIKFGDVVQAPPKLVTTFPKGLKRAQHASQERLRLQAIDAYRNRRGWTSRPGVQLPLTIDVPPSL